jgi:acyl carrier protein
VKLQPGGEAPDDHRVADLRLWDDHGAVVVDLHGLRLDVLPALPARPAEPTVADHGFVVTLLEAQPERRRPLMLAFLVEQAAGILRQDVSDIEDLDLALFEIGMTSLMITELQYRIQKKLGFRLPARKGFEFDTPDALADFLIKCALEARDQAASPPP